MATPKTVLYDQTGPAAGTRAATRSTITATTRKKAAPSFQTQPKFLTIFDPHFGHVTLAFMELVRVTYKTICLITLRNTLAPVTSTATEQVKARTAPLVAKYAEWKALYPRCRRSRRCR